MGTNENNGRVWKRRHWLALAARAARLVVCPPRPTGELLRESYDRIAGGYDDAWTLHMRDLSAAMLDRLGPPAGAECIDLACGTGFLTAELARRTGGRATGVDASAGMIEVARRRLAPSSTPRRGPERGPVEGHGGACRFVHAGALEFLRARPARSADVVICGWALGYTRPAAVLRQAARVLRPGGRVGIIDNRLSSLREVIWSSVLAFAERPAALDHVMRVAFLPSASVLAWLLRLAGLGVAAAWEGQRTFHVAGGAAAIDRLRATGAAAGFELAARPAERDAVFARFAEIMEQRYGTAGGVPITHRYLAAVGVKPCST